MRMHGHAEHDPADYVPRELFDEWATKDPVELSPPSSSVEARLRHRARRSPAMRDEARRTGIEARKKSLATRCRTPDREEERVYA